MSAHEASTHPGDVIAGKYRVERVLGRGGMGVVLAVTNVELGEPRALKLLGPAAMTSDRAVDRFLREARATARLQSPHVVRVFDVGMLDDGAPYMAMEYLEGTDLGDMLKRRGALPAHEAAQYLLEACEALAEAHAAGIIHRDIKPQNLFLARRADGPPCLKVLDFGISKVLTLDEEDAITMTNAVLGSPAYMSPEQIRSARDVDARTDIWALGVVLYQLVTGNLPFQSADATEFVTRVFRSAPALPSVVRRGLPLALDGVVMRCLEKDPARRYASIAELAEALAPFVPVAPGAVAPRPVAPVAVAPAQLEDDPVLPIQGARTRGLIIVAAVAAVLALGIAIALARAAV